VFRRLILSPSSSSTHKLRLSSRRRHQEEREGEERLIFFDFSPPLISRLCCCCCCPIAGNRGRTNERNDRFVARKTSSLSLSRYRFQPDSRITVFGGLTCVNHLNNCLCWASASVGFWASQFEGTYCKEIFSNNSLQIHGNPDCAGMEAFTCSLAGHQSINQSSFHVFQFHIFLLAHQIQADVTLVHPYTFWGYLFFLTKSLQTCLKQTERQS
jgi:hypothetical protein